MRLRRADRTEAVVRLDRCDTCIFGANNPVSAERVRGMLAATDANGSYIPCHHHLDERKTGLTRIICRGLYDARPTKGAFQIAARFGILRFTDDAGRVVACSAKWL